MGTKWDMECEAFSTMPGIESKGSKYSRWFDCHALFFSAFVDAVVLGTLKLYCPTVLCYREMVQNSANLAFGCRDAEDLFSSLTSSIDDECSLPD